MASPTAGSTPAPSGSADGSTRGRKAGAKRLDVELHVIEVRRAPYDYEGAFAEAVRAKAEAPLVLGSANFVPARSLIAELALKYHLPSISGDNPPEPDRPARGLDQRRYSLRLQQRTDTPAQRCRGRHLEPCRLCRLTSTVWASLQVG